MTADSDALVRVASHNMLLSLAPGMRMRALRVGPLRQALGAYWAGPELLPAHAVLAELVAFFAMCAMMNDYTAHDTAARHGKAPGEVGRAARAHCGCAHAVLGAGGRQHARGAR